MRMTVLYTSKNFSRGEALVNHCRYDMGCEVVLMEGGNVTSAVLIVTEEQIKADACQLFQGLLIEAICANVTVSFDPDLSELRAFNKFLDNRNEG